MDRFIRCGPFTVDTQESHILRDGKAVRQPDGKKLRPLAVAILIRLVEKRPEIVRISDIKDLLDQPTDDAGRRAAFRNYISLLNHSLKPREFKKLVRNISKKRDSQGIGGYKFIGEIKSATDDSARNVVEGGHSNIAAPLGGGATPAGRPPRSLEIIIPKADMEDEVQSQFRLLEEQLLREQTEWKAKLHEVHPENDGVHPSRRSFVFQGLGAAATVVVGVPVLRKAVKALGRWIGETLSYRRRDLVTGLFLPSHDFDVIPARDHPLLKPKGITYSNELAAIDDMKRFWEPARHATAELYDSDPDQSIVCLGSSISHKEFRKVLGSPLEPCFDFVGEGFVASFEYSFQLLPHEPLVWRIQDGVPRPTFAYAIVDRKRNVVAVPNVDRTRRLLDDVVLVTRLPKRLVGPEVVLLGGLHGPAVRAIKQLFFDIDADELRDLASAIHNHKQYQAVFRVSELMIKGDPPTTIPGKICVDTAAVPADVTVRVSEVKFNTTRQD